MECMTIKGLHSMMMLLFTKIQKTKDVNLSPFPEMTAYMEEIHPIFNDIFRTNSRELREEFFGDPLIMWLWHLIFF
jgi:hypothetical protein